MAIISSLYENFTMAQTSNGFHTIKLQSKHTDHLLPYNLIDLESEMDILFTHNMDAGASYFKTVS